jgi:hypothetical protein
MWTSLDVWLVTDSITVKTRHPPSRPKPENAENEDESVRGLDDESGSVHVLDITTQARFATSDFVMGIG